jgi:small subunit ribosomal protein S1
MDTDYRAQDALQEKHGEAPAQAADAPARGENENGMEALLRDSEYAFRSLRRGETVEGTIVRVDQDEVLVDIGLKSEGIIPSRELYSEGEEAEPLHIGDRTLVYVVQPEGQEGHAILSLRRARMERSWREIEDLYRHGVIVEAPVVDFNKGGLIVDLKGIRGFVPVSQVLDMRNVSRQEGDNEEVSQTLLGMKGRVLPLKVIEINRSRNRLILSERAAVQERRTQLKDELMDQLAPGQIRRGVVSNLTSFGAFVDLGGADGLVHVSEMSYNRVNHPSEILQVGQEVDVYVLSVDKENRKIALSLKRALPDPWTTVEQRYHLGQVVPAVITKLAKFGAFAKVEEGLEGLIHLTELTDLPVQDAAQVVQEGQHVDVKIIQINSQRRRLGLSVRQAAEPLGAMESYGDVDETSPFATAELQSLEDFSPAISPAPAAEAELVPESHTPPPEQESLIPDPESEAAAETNGATAAAAQDISPAAEETALSQSEDNEPEVASAAPQASASE